MDKFEVGKILYDIGLLLEIQGESFFKSKAYYDASRTLELLEDDLEKLVSQGRLKDIKGIEFIYLTEKDVVRHELVQKIIRAYEKYETKSKEKE